MLTIVGWINEMLTRSWWDHVTAPSVGPWKTSRNFHEVPVDQYHLASWPMTQQILWVLICSRSASPQSPPSKLQQRQVTQTVCLLGWSMIHSTQVLNVQPFVPTPSRSILSPTTVRQSMHWIEHATTFGMENSRVGGMWTQCEGYIE